jgi:hypothetical protein
VQVQVQVQVQVEARRPNQEALAASSGRVPSLPAEPSPREGPAIPAAR